LAVRAQNRHSTIDRLGADEPGATSRTRLPGTAIHGQVLDEAAASSRGIAVIAKARAPCGDRFMEDGHDRRVECRRFRSAYALSRARGVDARTKQRLICVDVADSGDGALVHQHLLDCLAGTPKKDR